MRAQMCSNLLEALILFKEAFTVWFGRLSCNEAMSEVEVLQLSVAGTLLASHLLVFTGFGSFLQIST
jgi:hypothetical protein